MEIQKEFNPQYNNWKIWVEEGYKITRYTSDQHISNFSSFQMAYCPANADLDSYHTITDEENERLTEEAWEESQRPK